MPKIVVLDGYTLNPNDNPWTNVEKFGEITVYDRTPPDQVVARAQGAEIVLTNKTPITAEAIASLKSLRFIGVLATGYNIVDIHGAKERGIPVSNIPEYGTDAVAQFTFALILELCHRAGAHDATAHAGDWHECLDFCYWKFPLRELVGKTLGIIGYGRIGQRVAEIGHAFGMRIVINSRTKPKNLPAHIEWAEVADLCAKADVLTLHCPQTKENTKFINRALLATMKRDAFFINVSRGALAEEHDLAEALDNGIIAGAALDVLSAEPPKRDNPMFKAKNCIITPHIAWAPLEARKRMMQTTSENIAAFLKGAPINVVN